MKKPMVGIVVPCFNEEEVLAETSKRLSALLGRLVAEELISQESRIWFVDDGSTDRTWQVISSLSSFPDSVVNGIKLSRNCGHQVALIAGLMSAQGDALISIDADLQDDIEAIPKMVQKYHEGCDVVYGVRHSRSTDGLFKRISAEMYYRLLNKLGVEVVFNHADFRLLSRRAITALAAFNEANVYLRGLIPLLGFASAEVGYERGKRFAGQSKYPLRKMLALGWQGVTSFSAVPLKAITTLGVFISIFSVGLGVWALYQGLFGGRTVPGWASISIPLFMLSGIQLLCLGVIGEYVAKIFVETKRRPAFFVEKVVGASLDI